MNKYTEAIFFRRSIDKFKNDLCKYNLCSKYAGVLHCLERYDEAVVQYGIALSAGEKSVSYMDHYNLVTTFQGLGRSLRERGDNETAVGVFKEGLAYLEKQHNGSTPKDKTPEKTIGTGEILEIQLWNLIGEAYYAQEKYDEALEWLNRANKAGKIRNENSVDLALNYLFVGMVYHAQSEHGKAIEMFKKAQTIYHNTRVFFLYSGPVTTWIVESYLGSNQHRDAIDYCQLAMKIILDEIGEERASEHYSTALTLEWYAKALSKQDKLEDAVQMLELACVIYDARLGPDHPKTQRCREQLETDRNADPETPIEESNEPTFMDVLTLYALLGIIATSSDEDGDTTTRIVEMVCASTPLSLPIQQVVI